MANPVFVDCTADTWKKVATNVITGQIWRVKTTSYFFTYRVTGGAVPTERLEGMPIFRDGEPDFEEIKASSGIDIYIFCPGTAGRVRVDV